MHPVNRRVATWYLHTQSVTTAAEGVDATVSTKPSVSCQLTGASASLPIKWKAKCPG